jgi:hypothetical protein
MRRSLFQSSFWTDLDNHIGKAAIWCLGFTLIWMFISIGLHFFEGSQSYFELKAVLIFKLILVAVIYLGRYLLLAQYRRPGGLIWLFGIVFLLAASAQAGSIIKAGFIFGYILLKAADALVWGIFVAILLENILGLFRFWHQPQKISASLLNQIWKSARQDIIALGILLTLLAGLLYYYLISFYLLDTLFYSYLLVVLVLLIGLGFYIMIHLRLHAQLQCDIGELDREIDSYLLWQGFKEDPDLHQKVLQLRYLTLIRNYLAQIGRPRFLWQIWGSYLLFSAFILILPYIFGLAVEVGSLK